MNGWSGEARRLVPGDIAAAAGALKVPVASLVAVLAVESRQSGFDKQNRPTILREGHIYYRQLRAHRPDKLALAVAAGLAWPRWDRARYVKGQDGQYAWLDAACAIDRECAMRSCSYGLGQVLGENYAVAGYSSAVAMFDAFRASEQDQLAGMLRCIRAWGLVPAMVAQDWSRFARRYNGPANTVAYSAKLSAAHRQAVARLGHEAAVSPVPAASPVPPRPSRVRIYDADALNAAELARVRGGASEADDLNARELARIRGTDGP